MNDNPQAGLEETGLGRLDGLEKGTVYADLYHEELKSMDLTQRMAALTVNAYADRADLNDDDDDDDDDDDERRPAGHAGPAPRRRSTDR